MFHKQYRQMIVFLMLFVLAACSCSGCGSEQKPPRNTILSYAISSDITSLDPVRVTEDNPRLISTQIMETLVTYDERLTLRPLLAVSWEPLQGGKEWLFRLRENVRYHDDPCFKGQTRTVNANDVLYSLQRMLDAKTQTLGAFILTDIVDGAADFAAGKTNNVPGIIADDPLTVRIRLTKPYLQFPARLSLPFAAIIPREAVEFYGDQWGTHPVGTGPFKFNSWDIASGAIVLDRNFNYWNPIRTNLAGVHFRILKSEASQLAGFTQGEIDVFEVTPAISTQIFESGTRLNSRFANAQQIETSILKVHFVGLNFRTPVVKDKNFRLACNYAIDKEELTKKILSNMTVPANGVLPPALSGADGISLYQQDVNKARQLLKTSPYKGQELVYTTDNSTDSLAVAEYLQNQLANIGVKIRIDKNPESIWIDKLTKGEFDLAKLYFAYDYPSPDNGFSQFLKSNFAPTGPNFLYYTNSRFDALYDRALQQPDNTEATATFTQLNQIIRDDSPWIFLYYPKRVLIVRHGISGAKINPLSFSLLLTDTEKPS